MYTLSNFYQSKAWIKFRELVIAERLNDEDLIICEHCGKPIVRSYDIIAHHKNYLTEDNVNDVEIALNSDNIALVHHVCHNKIHDKLGNKQRKIYLVYGAPLSGKSTYVNNILCEGDLVIDMDNIWQCVSGSERYVKDGRLNSVVFSVRDTLIECVKYRRGKWTNAYIIGGYPLIGERQRICKELGAEEIYIESKKEECLERLGMCEDIRGKGELKKNWKEYILDWFERYSPPL